jgi:NAD(P)-dependent dehydrogenase (short-subunit alcohol dehydrogenase family)
MQQRPFHVGHASVSSDVRLGCGTGVGRGIAEALSAEGYLVVLTGRRTDVLEAAARQIAAETGGTVKSIPADIGDLQSVRALFGEIENAHGRLDLLVNNAGINVPAVPMEEITFEQWSAILAANLTGAFLCTQQAMRIMKAQTPRGGRIINNGSISATTPRPHSAPYTATKHAITGLTKSTALDGRPFDIACGQIDIGNAATEMAARMATGVPQADGSTKVEPLMDVRHVASAVVYMASLPLDANVQFMTIMATKMPFVGRG